MTRRLRAAAPSDRDAVLDLWVEAWSAAMPIIDFAARRSWFGSRLADLERTGSATIVGCAPDGSLAGFVVVDAATAYLDQLVVRPGAQGTGLAGALMAAAKQQCPAGLGLHVNQDNRRAVRFYERQGFSIGEAETNPRSGLPVWRMHWPGEPPSAAPR